MVRPPRDIQLGFQSLVSAVGGREQAARLAKVSVRSIRRWEAGCPPWPVAALLWWQSSWAEHAIDCDIRYQLHLCDVGRRNAEARARELQAKVDALTRLLQVVDPAANDAVAL